MDETPSTDAATIIKTSQSQSNQRSQSQPTRTRRNPTNKQKGGNINHDNTLDGERLNAVLLL